MRRRHVATTTPPTSISSCGCTSVGVRHRLRSRTAGLARTDTQEGKHSRFAGRRSGIASRTTSITTSGGLKKMLDSPSASPLGSISVGASLPKSQALRSNPRGFSRSGGELQSDTGSRSRMDSTAQHSNAVLAQLVERLPCKERVAGSSPCRWLHDQASDVTGSRPGLPSLGERSSILPGRSIPNTGTTMPEPTNRRNLAHPWPSGSGQAATQRQVAKPPLQQGSTALPTGSRTGKRA